MESKAKHWLGLGVLVLIAGFAGLNAPAFNHAEAMLRFSDGGPRTTMPEQIGSLHRMKVLLAGLNIHVLAVTGVLPISLPIAGCCPSPHRPTADT